MLQIIVLLYLKGKDMSAVLKQIRKGSHFCYTDVWIFLAICCVWFSPWMFYLSTTLHSPQIMSWWGGFWHYRIAIWRPCFGEMCCVCLEGDGITSK